MHRPPRIHVLPDVLVNRIAAGEVIERPASVVKELLENALDAQATRVIVDILDGGRQLIRVTDDGCGLSAEELTLSIKPHATSKIRSDDDLFRVTTMGFRGEALASISAVAKLRLFSREPSSDAGHEIILAGDQIERTSPAAGPPGTSVEVRDLFFNVPARRRFLKSHATEVGHIHDQIQRVALAHPNLAVELTSNGRTSLQLPGDQSRVDRVARLFSPELASDLFTVERDEAGVRLEAYLAPPVHARANPQGQFTFVNGRYVRDRFLLHAMKEAYRGFLEPNRHGLVFLFLTVDPATVDVNVHPIKIEVRWADSGLIHSLVLSALRETLQRADLTPLLRSSRPTSPIDTEQQERTRRELADLLKQTPPIVSNPTQPGFLSSLADWSGPLGTATGHGDRDPTIRSSVGPAPDHRVGGGGLEIWRALYGSARPADQDAPDRERTSEPPFDSNQGARGGTGAFSGPGHSVDSAAGVRTLPADPWLDRPRAIQLHNLYLVAETDDGIVIVDQHALHERVMYEQLKRRFAAGPLESQRLLLPEIVRVTPRQAQLIEDRAPLLADLGIEISRFAPDTVAVHAFPAMLKDAGVSAFMADFVDYLDQNAEQGGTEAFIHHVLDMMACKAAVKAGDPLSDQEIQSLLAQRHLLDQPGSCPHGRPTTLRLTKAELDRQFKRT